MANDDDGRLCARAAAGDHAAFGVLVTRHEAALRGFLSRMAGEEADDIAQEAFLKAWRNAGQYDGRARFSTWLTSIAWRCFLDLRRRRGRPPREAAMASEVACGEFESQVVDMVTRLPAAERAALILCEGHGWSHGEAATMLGIPLGTVKTRISRAKRQCRAMWNGERHGG